MRHVRAVLCVAILAGLNLSSGAGEKPPHGYKTVPGPALSAQDAIAKMQLPPGFKLELVASEPEIVNPTSFTFDDRGRIWVTESVEYPRPDAGKGKDRVKILEDTDGDGKIDKVTVFKDGLNIPCGVVMGNNGVYVTNSPDILFLQDTNGDGVCDKEEVILTGFGRSDRHELPNSLTWGPDGWLYGLNGVFNGSTVVNQGNTFKFTCALWRWHPKTKKFEIFSEGTSNPWGLDYNAQGDWFVSCCVIDHLFHLTQSGYYHRQGGPYPPFTHKLNSISTERHQAAAYSGLCIYQADAYPEEYRGQFFMGNLHGSAINRDVLTRNGATYVQKNAPDFAQANDLWFMPVSQKIGPDGCIYLIDWYDRYHCYQDSGRPDLDRERGRLYRISYNDTPRAKPFDISKFSNEELLKQFSNANVWWRRTAQRLLNERLDAAMIPTLQTMALSTDDKTQAHMHALWLLCSQDVMPEDFHLKLLGHSDPVKRNWGVRAAGQIGKVSPAVYEKLKSLVNDPSADVRVQVPIAAARITQPDPLPLLLASLSNPENAKDPLIPTIIYNNLKQFTNSRGGEIIDFIEKNQAVQTAFGETVVPWLKEVINAVATDIKKITDNPNLDPKQALASLRSISDAYAGANTPVETRAKAFNDASRAAVAKYLEKDGDLRNAATVVALWWRDAKALSLAKEIVADSKQDAGLRSKLLKGIADSGDAGATELLGNVLKKTNEPLQLRKDALVSLADLKDPKTTEIILEDFKTLPPEMKPMCMTALTRTAAAAAALVTALEKKQLARGDLNSNHVRQILTLGDNDLSKRITAAWGKVSTERDPERLQVIQKMKQIVEKTPGDASAGWKVFEAKCQQCHMIYGKGNEVGPDLTGVGRDTLDLLLSNVLDPSLEIQAAYEVHVVRTKGGKVITGIVAEDSDKQLVLKREGGVLEKINREDIEKHSKQNISLMPEGLERTMTEKEFCDLVAFLLMKTPPEKK